jgi:hypothetical protein
MYAGSTIVYEQRMGTPKNEPQIMVELDVIDESAAEIDFIVQVREQGKQFDETFAANLFATIILILGAENVFS